MSIRIVRREAAIEKMADHLLAEGLDSAALRPLATAAGTSDRMLLYYFSSREELLSVTLERVASRLATQLGQLVKADHRRSLSGLLPEVWAALQRDEFRPYMTIWVELSARALRGQEPQHKIAGSITDTFLAWATDRLEGRTNAERHAAAALLIVAVNGLHVLSTLGRESIANAALVGLFQRSNSR